MYRNKNIISVLSRSLLREIPAWKYILSFCPLSSFKSEVNIENLYPNSNPDFLRIRPPYNVLSTQSSRSKVSEEGMEKFSGYIPVDELQITASRSGGPGGQHVNKVNSKIEIRFHLESASWIPDWVKPRIAERERSRLTKDGFLVVKSDLTRKQMLNQADCLNKLRTMVYQACVVPRELTDEEAKLKKERLAKAKAGILREKRQRSQVKQNRSAPNI